MLHITIPGEGVKPDANGAMLYAQYFHGITEWARARVYPDGIECHYNDLIRPREAARLCAHAIRLEALKYDDDAHAWAHGGTGGKGLADRETLAAIDSTDLDERLAAAADLHRNARPFGPEAEPARLIARWLMGDAKVCPAAGHLARWTIHNGSEVLRTDAIWLAWWTIHGVVVLDKLTAKRGDEGEESRSGRGGRPPSSDAARRELLRVAVRRMHQAGWGKTALARRAGISRPTLDSWL
ncbi:hypothetical protein [Nocardia fluminea]|uniref:hypothetical protein n=1 Tax=Nocardia fluminea TaxID=134984 RepID=UPI0036556633